VPTDADSFDDMPELISNSRAVVKVKYGVGHPRTIYLMMNQYYQKIMAITLLIMTYLL